MAQIDQHYQHWDGAHENIWRRRWIIAVDGLRTCMAQKWMKRLVGLCWMFCLVQVVMLFFYGSLLDKDSMISDWMRERGGVPFSMAQNQMVVLAKDNPTISISLPYNIVFSVFSSWSVSTLTITIVALCLAVPRLITPDLSSRAIVIYSSKAVTRFDYFLGKFGAVMLLLTLTWLGPVLVSWVAGNLLSPWLSFLWYSRDALIHSLVFILIGMVVLGMLTLGVSASSKKTKSVVALWLGLWLLGGMLSLIGRESEVAWLKYVSFRYNLEVLHDAIFNLAGNLQAVSSKYPAFEGVVNFFELQSNSGSVPSALISLGLMLGVAAFILHKRVNPE